MQHYSCWRTVYLIISLLSIGIAMWNCNVDKPSYVILGTTIVIGISGLLYFILKQIGHLKEQLRAMERSTTELTNRIVDLEGSKHTSVLPTENQSRRPSCTSLTLSDRRKADEKVRLAFWLTPTYTSWLMRRAMIRSAIIASKVPILEEENIYGNDLCQDEHRSDILTSSMSHQHSPLCSGCVYRLTSGRFRARLNGIRENSRVFSMFYKARTLVIHKSAQTGCMICSIVSTTLQDGENFITQAKSHGLDDEECFEMSTFFDGVVDVLTISLNFFGKVDCVMDFQLEVQNGSGTMMISPHFKVFLAQDSPPFEHITSQTPITDVVSSAAFSQAKLWLNDCNDSHVHCPRHKTDYLPSRVLEVSFDNTPGSIKLVEGTALHGSYVALSYCWGQDQRTVLTRRRLRDFMKGLPVDSLPQTILDAIEITRKLNIKYLWVDALCIIQDSQEDKKNEIAQMAKIYNNSYVTISAASAASVSDGFLHQRQPWHMQQLIRIPLRFHQNDELAILSLYDGSQMWRVGSKNSPIEKRGWALQEKLLSRRVLFYGTTHLQWTCRSIPLESGDLEVLQGSFLASTLRPISVSGEPSRCWNTKRSLYEGWERTILELTQRSFTHSEDILRAVAGIATKYQGELQDQYVAGLWKGALEHELLWHGNFEHDPSNLQSRPYRYIAPSWSWASRMGSVVFEPYETDDHTSNIIITGCCIVLEDHEILVGDIVHGHITIKGPIKLARLVSVTLFDLQPEMDEPEAMVYIDSKEDLHEKYRQSRTIASDFDVVSCLRLTRNMGLVLRQTRGNEHTEKLELKTYRRIGCFQVYREEWLSDCQRAHIVIV